MNENESDPAPASDPELFANEHLGRVENRINVAIFGAQAIPVFWERFCDLLKLDRDVWLERVVIDGTSLRPDFLVRRGDEKLCWIEVELGGRNKDQLANYQKALTPQMVVSIVGLAANPHDDPSLEQVRQIALQESGTLRFSHPQASAVLRALAHLIDDGKPNGSVGPAKAELPLEFLERFQTAVAPLLLLREHGMLANTPIKPTSISLRIKSGKMVMCSGSFALLTMTDKNNVALPAPATMRNILQGPLREVADRWEALLRRMYPTWEPGTDGNGRMKIPANAVEQHAVAFAEVFAPLPQHLLGAAG